MSSTCPSSSGRPNRTPSPSVAPAMASETPANAAASSTGASGLIGNSATKTSDTVRPRSNSARASTSSGRPSSSRDAAPTGPPDVPPVPIVRRLYRHWRGNACTPFRGRAGTAAVSPARKRPQERRKPGLRPGFQQGRFPYRSLSARWHVKHPRSYPRGEIVDWLCLASSRLGAGLVRGATSSTWRSSARFSVAPVRSTGCAILGLRRGAQPAQSAHAEVVAADGSPAWVPEIACVGQMRSGSPLAGRVAARPLKRSTTQRLSSDA